MAATLLLGLMLLEGAVETYWRGAPIRLWILAAAACWALAMIPATLFLGWGGRLFLTTAAVVGVIVLAEWRVGPVADPGLTVLTLPLPHLRSLLVAVALVLLGALIARSRIVRSVPILMAIALLLTLYCALPFAFAAVYGTPFDAAVRGAGFWAAPPLWLQGGFLALQLLVPLGFLLSVFAWLGAIGGVRKRRNSATFPAVCLLVFAAAFAVGSVELARAGIPNVASRYTPEWLPPFAQSAAAAPAAQSASSPGGLAGVQPASPATTQPAADMNDRPIPSAHPLGRGATTKAVALTVDSVEFVSDVGGQAAPPGQMFVIVRTTWQSLTALGAAGQPATPPAPYVVLSVHDQLWLLTDGRYADAIDEAATASLDRHLPIGTLTLPASGEALTGQVAFKAPASASFIAMVLLDRTAGNALVAVKGRPIDAPPAPALGPSGSNQEMTMTVTGAGWSDGAPAAPAGYRYFTLGLQATGHARAGVVMADFSESGRLETDNGTSAEPQPASWLRHPLPRPAPILPGFPNEGQLAFLIPADTRSARFVLRPKSGGAIDLPITSGFASDRPDR